MWFYFSFHSDQDFSSKVINYNMIESKSQFTAIYKSHFTKNAVTFLTSVSSSTFGEALIG